MKVNKKIFIIIYCIIVYFVGFACGFLSIRAIYKDKNSVSLSSLDSFEQLENIDSKNPNFLESIETINYNSSSNGGYYEYITTVPNNDYYLIRFVDYLIPESSSILCLTIYDLFGNYLGANYLDSTFNFNNFYLVRLPNLFNNNGTGIYFNFQIYGPINEDIWNITLVVYRVGGFNNAYDIGYDYGFNIGESNGYNNGYESGVLYGDSIGYNRGYDLGYEQGVYAENRRLVAYYESQLEQSYNNGYNNGYDSGYSDKGFISNTVDNLNALFSVNIFGDLSLGNFIFICFSVVAFFFLLKFIIR